MSDNDINKLKSSTINYWTIEFEFTIAEEVGYINKFNFFSKNIPETKDIPQP